MDDKALAAIAFELYALPFEEFVAARTAAAKATTGSGKELPAAVKALPKPSAAAWAVNMLAIHEPGMLAQLAELGQRMRGPRHPSTPPPCGNWHGSAAPCWGPPSAPPAPWPNARGAASAQRSRPTSSGPCKR
nr:hypothetical protein [Pseudarthrobacter psychrotolerans]